VLADAVFSSDGEDEAIEVGEEPGLASYPEVTERVVFAAGRTVVRLSEDSPSSPAWWGQLVDGARLLMADTWNGLTSPVA
jgi:hypothetical protein